MTENTVIIHHPLCDISALNGVNVRCVGKQRMSKLTLSQRLSVIGYTDNWKKESPCLGSIFDKHYFKDLIDSMIKSDCGCECCHKTALDLLWICVIVLVPSMKSFEGAFDKLHNVWPHEPSYISAHLKSPQRKCFLHVFKFTELHPDVSATKLTQLLKCL